MVKSAFFSALVFYSLQLAAQPQSLSLLGQTPGGAGFHVNWDSTAQQLIVGCGTSIRIYNISNPDQPILIAQRPLKGIVNETEVYGNVLFAAATHDGLYAFDYTSADLDIIAHIDMHNSGDTAAYDLWRSNDTLYVADNFRVRRYKFNGTSFQKLSSFGPYNSFCVASKGDYIVVGGQSYLYTNPLGFRGNISIYHKSNLTSPLATWKSELINVVQDVQFADLRDDIIYVCAGPEDMLFTKSNLIALHYNGTDLLPVDTFHLEGGVLLLAQLNIMNLDSRNDTLYVVTTAAWDGTLPPLTYMPVIDATGLPADTMKMIGKVSPGLWHFDAALMDGTPYIAMSSEWLGVMISDVSQLQTYDTLCLIETGGWCVNNRLEKGFLWACQEGYGLTAYDPDSLLFVNGFHCQSKKMNIFDTNNHYFSSDFEFLNDSLLMINSSEVYNIKPWLSGGTQQIAFDMHKNWMTNMRCLQTNTGKRMVATYNDLFGGKWISLFDPFDAAGNYHDMALDSMFSDAGGMQVQGDTVYYGKSFNNIRYLCAQRVYNDGFVFLDTIKLSMGLPLPPFDHEIHSVSIDNGIIAVAYGQQFAFFDWNGSELHEIAMEYDPGLVALDVVLRNNFLYVADRFQGLKIYDVTSSAAPVLVGVCKGTGGWKNLYGSSSVSVGPDGSVYLSDFHGGVFIIEAFDTTSQGVADARVLNEIYCAFPNPSGRYIHFEKSSKQLILNGTISIRSSDGRLVRQASEIQSNRITIDCSGLADGLYFYEINENLIKSGTGKFIISSGK